MGLLKRFFLFFGLIAIFSFVSTNVLQAADNPTGISHVILIGVDGGGTFFRDADTPNLDRIFADGAVTYRCLCENPTISAENWGAILHGVKREIHGLTNGLAYSTPYPDDSPYPSVFRVIRENMPEAKLASICSWNPINIGVIENGIGVFKDKVPDDDAGVTEKVCEYLEKNQPTLLYVHYNEVDGAGHGHGFGGEKHLAKLHATDGYIQKIYEAAKKNGMLDSTLFIVTADHGGRGTMHGGWTDEEKYVMFAATGPGLEKGEIGEIENRDMPAVILYALGLADKQPETWTSRVPSGLFKGVKAKERPVYKVKFAYEHREHASTPTPKSGSDAASILGKDRVRFYLPFDGDAKDATGKIATKERGKLAFVDGYFGQGAQFNDGYVALSNWQPGKKSFSLAFWMKTNGVSADPVILSNKDWSGGSRPGFVVSLRSLDIKFNYGDGKIRMDADGALPRDFYGGWVYVVIVVDRDAGAVKISYDFNRFELFQIREEFLNVSFDCFPELAIGQDATGKYKEKLDAVLDEFLLIDGTLDAVDVAKLKELYQGGNK